MTTRTNKERRLQNELERVSKQLAISERYSRDLRTSLLQAEERIRRFQNRVDELMDERDELKEQLKLHAT